MKFQKFYIPVLLVLLAGCSINNVDEDKSLKAFFDEHKVIGSFGLFDNGHGDFTVYNLKRFRDSSFLPASTFKIVNALIALETGIAPDEKMVIQWDGIQRPIESWNQDLTMNDAFSYSAVPYFQELARRIGKEKMQKWLDTIGYARRYDRALIQENLDTFWLDNSVRITADEQLGLVKKLYFNQLPFKDRSQRIVKQMMIKEDNSNYKLSYKTGLAVDSAGYTQGWVVGWIEENMHPYFFSLNVQSTVPGADIADSREAILRSILEKMGFFKGRK
jgi:beta-lactamase class D